MSSDIQLGTSLFDETKQETDILHRFLDHWFAPTAHDWPWYRRLVFTLAGSSTFFLAWILHIFSSTGVASAPDVSADFLLFFPVVGLLGTIWFAGLLGKTSVTAL